MWCYDYRFVVVKSDPPRSYILIARSPFYAFMQKSHAPNLQLIWIDKLIGIEGEENTTQETRFANYLRQLFPADVRTMTVAARALGKTHTPCQVFRP